MYNMFLNPIRGSFECSLYNVLFAVFLQIIDHEFVRLGKCWADIGWMFADMVAPYYYHLVSPEDADSHRQIASEIRDSTYHLGMTSVVHLSVLIQHQKMTADLYFAFKKEHN